MTTAELIKNKEEVKNNPQPVATPAVTPTAAKPAEGVGMAEARVAGNSDGQQANPENVGSPLYDAGVKLGSLRNTESELKGKSPITTPEYDKFRNEVIGARMFDVETDEQRKKRERADLIKQGLVGLTDGLSSLANLYYTTKWAPNQKRDAQLPKLQRQLYNERMERDKKLENFRAWQRAKANKDDERGYNLNLYNMKLDAEAKKAAQKAKADAQAAEIKFLRDLGLIDARKAAELETQKDKAALDKELEGIRQKNRVSLASMNNRAAMDRAITRGGGGANSTIRVPIGNEGEYAEYRKNDLTNAIVISQIYNSLPNDYRVRQKKQAWNEETNSFEYPFEENPSTQKMQEAIGKALSDGYLTEMAPEIQVGGKKNGEKSKSLPGVENGEKGNKKSNKHLNL